MSRVIGLGTISFNTLQSAAKGHFNSDTHFSKMQTSTNTSTITVVQKFY